MVGMFTLALTLLGMAYWLIWILIVCFIVGVLYWAAWKLISTFGPVPPSEKVHVGLQVFFVLVALIIILTGGPETLGLSGVR